MIGFPFLVRVARGSRRPFYYLSLFFRQFRPRLHSTFLAARATFSVAHIKLFFHDKLSYLLETFPRVS
jgi:hypothetical protein